MGGFLAVKNFAPYICHEVMGPKAPDGYQYEYCGRVNRSGAPLPTKMRGCGGSSIILESCAFSGSYGHSHQAEVYLVEIPAQLVIRDSWMEAEVGNTSYQVVRFDPAIEVNGRFVASTSGFFSATEFV